MDEFINLLAWVFCYLSFLFILVRVGRWLLYSQQEQVCDIITGKGRKTFPIIKPIIIFIICACWVFSR